MNKLPDIDIDEYLFRGVIEQFWDYENNRPSSAIYKDSKGVSVDRSYDRSEQESINRLLETRDFFAVYKITKRDVVETNAIVKYVPLATNIYHSEIHDSNERIKLRGSKPKKLRDKSQVVFIK